MMCDDIYERTYCMKERVAYRATLIKKINFFPIYKEIKSGAVAKSYMRKDFPINEQMGKYFPIYKEAVSYT